MKTIYTVKSLKQNFVWEFHYDLKGVLTAFKIAEGSEITQTIKQWLFSPQNFPYEQATIEKWKAIKLLDISVGLPDVSFNTFYKAYNYKVKRLAAEKAFSRLNKTDKLAAIAGISRYEGLLFRNKGQAKAYPATYLNQRRWEDQY